MKIREILTRPEGHRLKFKQELPASADLAKTIVAFANDAGGDIRNRVIAPVFKRLGLIDQWGNGLKIIAEELISYPEIELKWFEKGLQFQVQFVRRNFHPAVQVTESDGSFGTWPAPSRH